MSATTVYLCSYRYNWRGPAQGTIGVAATMEGAMKMAEARDRRDRRGAWDREKPVWAIDDEGSASVDVYNDDITMHYLVTPYKLAA